MHLQPPAAQEVRGHEACTAKKVCGQPCPGHMGPFPRNEEGKVREHARGKRCHCSLRIPHIWSALCKMVCNCPCLVQCQSFEFFVIYFLGFCQILVKLACMQIISKMLNLPKRFVDIEIFTILWHLNLCLLV